MNEVKMLAFPITSPLPGRRANLLHPRSTRTFFSHPPSRPVNPTFRSAFLIFARADFWPFFPLNNSFFFFFFFPSSVYGLVFHFFPPSLIPPLLFQLRLSSTLLLPFNPSVVLSRTNRSLVLSTLPSPHSFVFFQSPSRSVGFITRVKTAVTVMTLRLISNDSQRTETGPR